MVKSKPKSMVGHHEASKQYACRAWPVWYFRDKGEVHMELATDRAVKISVTGAAVVPHNELIPFQGELKALDKINYEKLRKTIIDLGFSFVFHVWQNEGKNYIIDGHQRLFTLNQMATMEGWQIPQVPIAIVHADSFEQAKRKVLAGASTYGRLTEQGLFDYLKANDIPFDEVVSNFDFVEVNFQKFSEKFYSDVPKIPEANEVQPPEMKSSSEQVRQLQLFFNDAAYDEFLAKVNELSIQFNRDNVTDTVLECVREAHRAKFPAAH